MPTTGVKVMSTKEQRMIAAHKLGIRDYREGKAMLPPVHLNELDECDCYRAGYEMEHKRDRQRKLKTED
jgi:hypothetical protein